MRIAGEIAREWTAIRLDSFDLTMADSESGTVEWVDRTGNKQSATLGAHAIRIIRKFPYGR